jgi:hypothetical protein
MLKKRRGKERKVKPFQACLIDTVIVNQEKWILMLSSNAVLMSERAV